MFQDKFDPIIKSATSDHLPANFDWRLIKAQLIAESNLNELAKSSVGALGIAQFMPNTWDEIKSDMGLPAHAACDHAQFAVPGCCHYMHQLWDDWTAKREFIDRYCLALASYNAGTGNILKAQQRANNANDYATIIKQLYKVTGESNAKQTTDYVQRILSIWLSLVLDKKVY